MSLLSPQNGNVQFTSTLQDATATYSCITGYTVVGPSNRTCLSSGLWSGSDPTCEREIIINPNTLHSIACYTNMIFPLAHKLCVKIIYCLILNCTCILEGLTISKSGG